MRRQSTGIGFARLVAGIFAIAMCAGAARAQTEDRAAVLRRARQHFLEGRKAFEGKRYPAALEEFQAGYDLEPRPAFLLDMAHAARKMGDLKRARELYQRFLASDPPGPPADRRVAEQMTRDIDRKLGMTQGSAATPAVAEENEAAPAGDEPSEPPDMQPPPAPPPKLESLAVERSMLAPVAEPRAAREEDAEKDQDQPHATRWWLWTGLGLLVAGAAAVLILRSGGGDDGHSSGSWGQVKL